MLNSRRIFWAIIIIGLAICLFGIWKYHGFFTDDSYISLRYSQNLIEGYGLVWNPGERVEGYSNFLFLLLVTILGWTGIDLRTAAQIIGLLSFVSLLLYLVWRQRQKSTGDETNQAVQALPILLTAGSYCMVIWSIGGLETTLFSLLVAAGVLTAVDGLQGWPKSATVAGVLLGLATLTRPDGGLFFIVPLFFYLWQVVRHRPQSGFRLMLFSFPFMLLVGTHEVWRFAYYGQLLPNTWYVKGIISWDRLEMGWRYLLGFAITQPFLLVPFLLTLVYRVVIRRWDVTLSLLSISVFAFILYVASIGGDHMLAYRPFIAIIPLMSVVIALGVKPLLSGIRGLVIVSAFVLLIISQIPFPGLGIQGAERPDGAAYCGEIVGRYIDSNWPGGSLVALNSAGATPYFAPHLRFLDMLGLNDTTIARRKGTPIILPYQIVPGHAKGDGRYVFDRQPDFIIAGPSNGSDIYHARTLSEYELAHIYEFRSTYRLKTVRIPVSQYARHEEFSETRSGEMLFTYYERIR
jgi:hypothetical protein